MEELIAKAEENSQESKSRFLLRGESLVATMGFAFAGILILTLVAASYWAVSKQKETEVTNRNGGVKAVSQLIAQTAENQLRNEEYTALRTLMGEVARQYGLTKCRVTLPDGHIIADAEPSRINMKKLPTQWPTGTVVGEAHVTSNESMYEIVVPLTIGDRGKATLTLSTSSVSNGHRTWELLAGIGVIGAIALVSMLLMYRKVRYRTQAMSAIREALLAMSKGETEHALMSVNDSLGKEARAWNELLAAHEHEQDDRVEASMLATLGNRRESNGDLDNLCDAMSSGLLLINDQFEIQYANGAAAVFLKTKRDVLMQRDLRTLIDSEEVNEAIGLAVDIQKRRRAVLEVKHDSGDGECVLRYNIRPLRKNDHAAVMLVIDDVTQQRVADEARNSFVAHATHELRTPLSNIRLYLELLLEGEAPDEHQALNVVNTETRRLERLVSDMLSMSEMETGSFQLHQDDVRIDEIFNDLVSDYAPSAKEKNIGLKFNIAPKLPTIKGDRDKISMALHNLISNALKYTPEDGSVTVNLSTNESQIVVEVIDTGIGLTDEDAEKVFEKFYRAQDKRVRKITGTGLGLALAREVIRLHGGDVMVQSVLNEGSTFTLTLPVVVPQVV